MSKLLTEKCPFKLGIRQGPYLLYSLLFVCFLIVAAQRFANGEDEGDEHLSHNWKPCPLQNSQTPFSHVIRNIVGFSFSGLWLYSLSNLLLSGF